MGLRVLGRLAGVFMIESAIVRFILHVAQRQQAEAGLATLQLRHHDVATKQVDRIEEVII